jgi:hypothetical protein
LKIILRDSHNFLGIIKNKKQPDALGKKQGRSALGSKEFAEAADQEFAEAAKRTLMSQTCRDNN